MGYPRSDNWTREEALGQVGPGWHQIVKTLYVFIELAELHHLDLELGPHHEACAVANCLLSKPDADPS